MVQSVNLCIATLHYPITDKHYYRENLQYSTSLAEVTIDAEMYGETQANMDS